MSWVDIEKCTGCKICVEKCSVDTIFIEGDKAKINMEDCAQYLRDIKEKDKCLQRMRKYFNKEKVVAEKTLEELEKLN